jgi:hypothetical protein
MKFFVLQNPKTDQRIPVTDFVPVDGSRTGEASRCPVCGNFVGMLPLLPPVRVEIETWGTNFGDIAFGPSEELLLSERFWTLYQHSGLTGLTDVGSVEVAKLKSHQKLREATPRYYCCRAGHSRAAIDDAKSGLERDEPSTCKECRLGGVIKRIQRVVFEPNSWSGEDLFFSRGLPGTILASEEFEKFCRGNKISNCLLIPAEEFSFDHYPKRT